MFSSSSVASLIISRFDTQDSFGFLNIRLILEADLDLVSLDLVVVELAFGVPLLDILDVLSFLVLHGRDVPELLFLVTEHGDVAGYRAVSVALRIAESRG